MDSAVVFPLAFLAGVLIGLAWGFLLGIRHAADRAERAANRAAAAAEHAAETADTIAREGDRP